MKKMLFIAAVFFTLTAIAQASNNLGSLQETIGVGKTLSIGLNPSSTGSWYLTSNSNSAVVTATISSSALTIQALSVGTSTVLVCTDTQSANCLSANVTVSGVLGASIAAHVPGTWVIRGQTVLYVTSAGLIPVPTWNVFLSNGGKASLIQPINAADLNLPTLAVMKAKDPRVGNVLGTSISAHAIGSWVLSGTTVFYVTPNGLIPITTWQIFLDNGGKASLIKPANSADLNLPLLPVMTVNDSRVE